MADDEQWKELTEAMLLGMVRMQDAAFMHGDLDPRFTPMFEDYGIPASLRGGLTRWLVAGIKPGSFLTAVLENDLLEAAIRADEENAPFIANIARMLFHECPSQSYGSPEALEIWHRIPQSERPLPQGIHAEPPRGLTAEPPQRCECVLGSPVMCAYCIARYTVTPPKHGIPRRVVRMSASGHPVERYAVLSCGHRIVGSSYYLRQVVLCPACTSETDHA